MLSFNPAQRIYLALAPVDMRKQFNVLWASWPSTSRRFDRVKQSFFRGLFRIALSCCLFLNSLITIE